MMSNNKVIPYTTCTLITKLPHYKITNFGGCWPLFLDLSVEDKNKKNNTKNKKQTTQALSKQLVIIIITHLAEYRSSTRA